MHLLSSCSLVLSWEILLLQCGMEVCSLLSLLQLGVLKVFHQVLWKSYVVVVAASSRLMQLPEKQPPRSWKISASDPGFDSANCSPYISVCEAY